MAKHELSEDIQADLKTIITHFDKEDRPVRERQLRMWRRMEFLWAGFSQTYWDDVAHDYRVFGMEESTDNDNDDYFYDKPVNVFRAYLESIIAALAMTVPGIKCSPADATNSLDLQMASAGDKISRLVYKHNDVSILWAKAFYIYALQGMVASYNYTNSDEKYGTYKKDQFEEEKGEQTIQTCSNCGNEVQPEESEKIEELESDEFNPDDEDALVQYLINNAKKDSKFICPQCLSDADPEIGKKEVVVKRLVGKTDEPKSRQIIEVLGGLNVKVPIYSDSQEKIPCLIYDREEHYTYALKLFPELYGVIGESSSGGYDAFEKWARLSTQYLGDYPNKTVTIRKAWIRPWAYYVLGSGKGAEEKVARLKRKFPNGAYVCLINDKFAEACNEDLDDHWTLTVNPLSRYIHFDPLGMLLTSIQEITNDVISLVLQTMEHGIGQTYADPSVVDFEAQRNAEAKPGMMFPTKPHSGRTLQESFYEIKTATLSSEVDPFTDKLESMGQFVSGAFPSIYGGDQSNSSRTAAQYSMSGQRAMQRLQTPWKMMTAWWKNTFAKVIPAYIQDVEYDINDVQKDKSGNFVNVLIRASELEGTLGSIELEGAESLPISPSQQQDILFKLFQMNNPEIIQALTTPENAYMLREVLGLPNFIVPGESDRNKQYYEIELLLNSAPVPGPPGLDGQPQEVPSIEAELLVDNHFVEATVLREWLVSEAGRQAKIDQPQGYKNCLLHLQQHIQMRQQLNAGMANGQQPKMQPQNPKQVVNNGTGNNQPPTAQ
jgi:hypothetical protein